MEDLTGRKLGKYEIVGRLGEGGMAGVFKARDPGLDRFVALKVLPRRFADDRTFTDRFAREAKVIATLDHPHILPVHDSGEADGYPYMVMPLVESGTLAQRIRGTPLPLGTLERVIRELADALDYAHARGVVHRDLKPSNVLLDARGSVRLTDFGIARILEADTKLTMTGSVLGTPLYMSPEQHLGEAVDRRSDVYSLGVILYELATGRVPFRAETPAAVGLKHIRESLPPPRSLNPYLPESIERAIEQAMAKRPEDRFATAGELAAAIAGVGSLEQSALPHAAPAAGVAPDGTAVASEPGAPAAPAPSLALVGAAPRGGGGGAWLAVVAGAVAVAAVAAGAWWWASRPTGRPPVEVATVAAVSPAPAPAPPSPPAAVAPAPAPTPPAPTSPAPTPPVPTPAAPESVAVPSPPAAASPPPAPPGAPPAPASPPAAGSAPPSPPAIAPAPAPVAAAAVPTPGPGTKDAPRPRPRAGAPRRDMVAIGAGGAVRTPFSLDRTEVTVAAYRRCVDAGRCTAPASGLACNWRGGREDHPVNCVDWEQAEAYCAWAGARLPTDAEWERAARGSAGRTYAWGDEPVGAGGALRANVADESARRARPAALVARGYDDGYADTAPVGSFPAGATPDGVADLTGNVWEWVADAAAGGKRTLRGGAYTVPLAGLAASNRTAAPPTARMPANGFRCARDGGR